MEKDRNKLAFFGTPQIAADLLEQLIEAGLEFDFVVTQPDRKKGRNKKVIFTPVKEVAMKYDIETFQPEKVRDLYDLIKDRECDLIITCAYGQIVGPELLEYPKYGCVNLHGSILPKYRGGAPVQRAIWDGLESTGVSLMKMDRGMDSGPVLDTVSFRIEDKNTGETFKQMSSEAAHLLLKNLDLILSGQAEFIPQDENEKSYAPILKREEELIDFSQPDWKIEAQIRAFAPEPGAYVTVNGKKLKIFRAEYEKGAFQNLGTFVLDGKKEASIGLNEGRLKLKEVQLEGKSKMDIASFVQGAGKALNGMKVINDEPKP